jgi:flagellar protein FlaG
MNVQKASMPLSYSKVQVGNNPVNEVKEIVNPTLKVQKEGEPQKQREFKDGQNAGQLSQAQEKNFIEVIEKANKKILGDHKEFQYSVHEQTKQIMVKVVNSETKEVLKEFPPEKILDMVASMCEAAGLFVDEKR